MTALTFFEHVNNDLKDLDLSIKSDAKLLSDEYRQQQRAQLTPRQVQAYLATRLPATFAAVQHVFDKIPLEPKSFLDIGAGPGTAFWAAYQKWQVKGIAIEQSPYFANLGARYTESATCQWILANVEEMRFFPDVEMACCSYSLGELNEPLKLLEYIWPACQTLVLIEPGTPKGFDLIRRARRWLLSEGGFMVAPCPHGKECPLLPGDWCHFAARLERSSLHRRLKDADRGFEDEKFSYVVISKEEVALPESRIIRRPERHSGHIEMTLCESEGSVNKRTLSQRHKERFKAAKKKDWGEAL